jgi:hypothetical protein
MQQTFVYLAPHHPVDAIVWIIRPGCGLIAMEFRIAVALSALKHAPFLPGHHLRVTGASR